MRQEEKVSVAALKLQGSDYGAAGGLDEPVLERPPPPRLTAWPALTRLTLMQRPSRPATTERRCSNRCNEVEQTGR
jgi:hypothetical protein